MHGLEIEQAGFTNPDADHRLAPFWFWNHDIKEEELLWQIREMHRQGVGGFCIHGRCGLITQYMSSEWMDLCEVAVREAERLGMKVYLYDDLDFPSGSAAGRVGEDPELRSSALKVAFQAEVECGALIDAEVEAPDGLVAVLAVPIADGTCVTDPDSVLDLRDHVTENRISWTAAAGRWLVMALARQVWSGGYNRCLGDYLNPAAMRKFIELSHQPYTQRLGDYFGKTVVGIFTDEPATTYIEPAIPWTRRLPDEFAADHGYDLLSALPSLLLDAGPESHKPRTDYWSTVGRLYSDSFFGQIGEFCRKHGLCSVGHLSSDGEFFLQARRQVDYFQCAKHLHFGGTDALFTVTWPAVAEEQGPDFDWNDVNNFLALKLASSCAHLYGKPRTMSEAFGVAGQWAIDLRTLKRLTDWQIALGIDLIMPHAFYYSLAGFRRWESPPGEFYQSTFWPFYREYADYTGRLCSLFGGGEHCADVAVLYPIRSMWTTNLSASAPDDQAKQIITGFTEVTRALSRAHHDFDIVPEELVRGAGGSDRLEIGDHAFSALVIPPCTALDDATTARIRRFVGDGGTVVLVGDVPVLTDEAPDRVVRVAEVSSGPRFERTLANALEQVVRPQVTITQGGEPVGDIICLKKTRSGSDFYFLANTSEDTAYSTRVSLSSVGTPSSWDARTGDVADIATHTSEGDWTVLDLRFEPTQSHVICVSPTVTSMAAARQSTEQCVAVLPDEWEFATEKPNVLPLTDWRLSMHAEPFAIKLSGAQRYDVARGWRVYQTSFESAVEIGNAKMVFPEIVGEHCIRPSNLPFTVKVEVNDTEVTQFTRGSYLDHHMAEAEVGHLLRKGMNHVTITTKVELYDSGGLNHPVLLVGDFRLAPQVGGWLLTETARNKVAGSWTDFGYPFYSGTGMYSCDAALASIEPGKRCFVRFESVGDLADVTVNGRSAGTSAWEPYEVDITSCVKPGTNRFEIRVANSLQNLLVLTPRASGILGKVEVIVR